MSITFTPYSATGAVADTSAAVRVKFWLSIGARGAGAELGIGESDTEVRFRLSADGTGGTQSEDNHPVIPPGANVEFATSLDGAVTLGIGVHGNTDTGFQLATEVLPKNHTELRFALSVDARAAPELTSYGFLMRRPPVVVGYGGMQFALARDALALNGDDKPLPILVAEAVLALGASRRAVYDGALRAADSIAFNGFSAYVVRVLAQSGLVLNGTATVDYLVVLRAASRLLLEGRAATFAEALAHVLDALVFAGIVDAMQKGEAADTLVATAALSSIYTAFAHLIDTLLVSAAASAGHTAFVLVRDTLLVGADLSHAADLAVLVRDSIGFAATLSIDNGEYIAWVINTESQGLSRYTNYPYNSFAKIGDRYYGAAADGLHRLDGDDDNGTAIAARLRMGLADLGTRKLKQIPEAYIGFSGTGTLLLRVISIHPETGARQEALYRLSPRGAASTSEARFQLGRGVKSVDWDFVLENVDGADFNLAAFNFKPVVLDRMTRN